MCERCTGHALRGAMQHAEAAITRLNVEAARFVDTESLPASCSAPSPSPPRGPKDWRSEHEGCCGQMQSETSVTTSIALRAASPEVYGAALRGYSARSPSGPPGASHQHPWRDSDMTAKNNQPVVCQQHETSCGPVLPAALDHPRCQLLDHPSIHPRRPDGDSAGPATRERRGSHGLQGGMGGPDPRASAKVARGRR